MDAERITMYVVPAILAALLVFGVSKKVFGQEPGEYKVVESGFCEDVQLRCVKVLFKDIEFYAMYRDGELVAITEKKPGEEEKVIRGNLKLPLKKGEYEI